MVMAHYLEAFDWQRRISRAFVLLGGKNPHPQTFVVGGMVLAPPWGGPIKPLTGEHPRLPERESPMALSPDGLAELKALISEMQAFVDRVYVPDVLAVAGYHEDWLGRGVGGGSYLSAGEFPEGDTGESPRLLPRGRVTGGDPGRFRPGRSGRDRRDSGSLVVPLRRRRRGPAPPLRRPDGAGLHRTRATVRLAGGFGRLQLAQGTPLRRDADGGRAARPDPRRLRRRGPPGQGRRGGSRPATRPRSGRSHRHPRPDRRPGDRGPGRRGPTA